MTTLSPGDRRVVQVRRVVSHANIYRTHPNLYVALMTVAVMSVALAANFLFTTPTFNPLDIPKNLVGAIFLGLGLSQLVTLNIWRNLKLVRVVLALSVGFTLFWGCCTSQSFFQGKSSLQLPILYVALAALQLPLLIEPATNPVTGNGAKKRRST